MDYILLNEVVGHVVSRQGATIDVRKHPEASRSWFSEAISDYVDNDKGYEHRGHSNHLHSVTRLVNFDFVSSLGPFPVSSACVETKQTSRNHAQSELPHSEQR